MGNWLFFFLCLVVSESYDGAIVVVWWVWCDNRWFAW